MINKLIELRGSLTDEINLVNSQILIDFPVSDYIKLLEKYPRCTIHNYASKEVLAFCRKIIALESSFALELYHKLLLVSIMELKSDGKHRFNLTAEAKSDYDNTLVKLLEDLKKPILKEGKYLYSNEWFVYNLGVVKHTTVSLGIFKLNISSLNTGTFLLRLAIKNSPGWVLNSGIKLVTKIRLYKPYFEVHVYLFEHGSRVQFSEQGWISMYRNVAGLLELNPWISGLYTSSYFFDPQLKKVSPHLSYIRDISMHIGGDLIDVGKTKSGVSNALFMSKRRKKLYDDGIYKPKVYFLVFNRKTLINWMNKQQC